MSRILPLIALGALAAPVMAENVADGPCFDGITYINVLSSVDYAGNGPAATVAFGLRNDGTVDADVRLQITRGNLIPTSQPRTRLGTIVPGRTPVSDLGKWTYASTATIVQAFSYKSAPGVWKATGTETAAALGSTLGPKIVSTSYDVDGAMLVQFAYQRPGGNLPYGILAEVNDVQLSDGATMISGAVPVDFRRAGVNNTFVVRLPAPLWDDTPASVTWNLADKLATISYVAPAAPAVVN